MGRKAEFKNRVGISSSLEKDELEAFDDITHRERKERAELIRLAILEYISNHKEGNNTFTLDKWKEDPAFKAVPSLLGTPTNHWYSYLQEQCSHEERLQIITACTKIKNQALNIENTEKTKQIKATPRGIK